MATGEASRGDSVTSRPRSAHHPLEGSSIGPARDQMSDPRHELAARRLSNQRLTGTPLGSVADVVRRLGAVRAQDYPLARWSIGLRARDLRETDVDQALASAQVVRTHVLRDTWHVVAAEDLRWLVELTRPRIQARNETMHRRLGLDAGLLARTDALIADVL